MEASHWREDHLREGLRVQVFHFPSPPSQPRLFRSLSLTQGVLGLRGRGPPMLGWATPCSQSPLKTPSPHNEELVLGPRKALPFSPGGHLRAPFASLGPRSRSHVWSLPEAPSSRAVLCSMGPLPRNAGACPPSCQIPVQSAWHLLPLCLFWTAMPRGCHSRYVCQPLPRSVFESSSIA